MVGNLWTMSAGQIIISPRKILIRKLLNRAIIVLIAILILEIVFHFIVAPNLRFVHIQIQGDSTLADDEILKGAGIQKQDFYFAVNEENLSSRLKLLPSVWDAKVLKIFPDTLKIVIKARTPLGLVIASGDGKSFTGCFDSEGVVFQIQNQIRKWDLPVISGIKFEALQCGMKFPQALKPLLNSLVKLQEKSPMLFSLISEIAVKKSDAGGFDAVLYPSGYPVRVLVGEDLNDKILRQVFIVLDLMRKEGFETHMKELDFRSEHVVFKSKEVL